MNRTQFFDHFRGWLCPAKVLALARATGWLKRQGKIDAFEFHVGLVFGQMSALGLSLSAQASCYTQPVKREAVHQRYNEAAVQFFHRSFQECLRQSLTQGPEPSLTQSLAQHFPAIHVVDSTSFDCPESLAQIYPGAGGAASAANCKVLLRYEYLRGHFEPLWVGPGKRSDQGLAGRLPQELAAGQLLLDDKGFFSLEVLKQIDQRGAYFLTPWCRSLTLGLSPSPTADRALNLAQELRQSQAAVVAWPKVYLGKTQGALAVRLVALRLSPESAGRHRAALREAQRKQGRQPTAQALELAGWLILMTNAPQDKLPTPALGYLYRVRWQIELVFKQCKSVLRLHVTKARHNPARVQCEIWARLLAAVVIFSWYAHLQAAAALTQPPREISFAQVARQLQPNGLPLALALIQGGERLREELWRLWRLLLHTTLKGRQRTRKTTWELLNENWLNPATP